MHQLAQTHDGRVDVSHRESFNRLPVLLLEGGEGEEDEVSCWIWCRALIAWEHEVGVTSEQNVRISVIKKNKDTGS